MTVQYTHDLMNTVNTVWYILANVYITAQGVSSAFKYCSVLLPAILPSPGASLESST